VRVVAGRFGGRRLRAPAGAGTRPTSDRVREALFSILGDLDGLRALDLYAGTGALGIEALSRGAISCTFVERDRRALAVLRANLESLGIDADVRPRDALRVLAEASAARDAYDLVFLDPPYRHAARMGRELSEALPAALAAGARVVCESDRRDPLDLDLDLRDERRYGDTLIRIHVA
jgi:16S rRNA (guanine966-N2)-methyltransferase